jgi:hypothetical protein
MSNTKFKRSIANARRWLTLLTAVPLVWAATEALAIDLKALSERPASKSQSFSDYSGYATVRAAQSREVGTEDQRSESRQSLFGSPSGSSSSGSSSSSAAERSKPSSSGESGGQSRDAATKPQGPEKYVCKIYCKSTSGPTIQREFQASSRAEAARIAGDQADGLCNSAGHGTASSRSLPENQCWKK